VASGKLIADFSNYGKGTVDVFAPGVKIYSTLPGGNQYGFLNGTSMAAPVVTGIAALVRSYYPKLTAEQVKYAIDKSATTPPLVRVNVPGTDSTTAMNELCGTGGFVNAYNALEIASTLKNETTADNKPKVGSKEMPVFVNFKESKSKN
jgi:subtilisin family serine protease